MSSVTDIEKEPVKANEDAVVVLSIEEMEQHIRKRPGMFFGSSNLPKQILNLFEALLKYSAPISPIAKCKLLPGYWIELEVFWEGEIPENLQKPEKFSFSTPEAYLIMFRAVSKEFELKCLPDNHLGLSMQMDGSIFFQEEQAFWDWSNQFLEFAAINPSYKLYLTDARGDFVSNCEFHFEGDMRKSLAFFKRDDPFRNWRKEHILEHQFSCNGRRYHIAIELEGCENTKSAQRTYSNYNWHYFGGSFDEGIVDAVTLALEKVRNANGGDQGKIKRKFVRRNLRYFGVVKGEDFNFQGCTKGKLHVPAVRAEVKTELSKFLIANVETKVLRELSRRTR